MLGLAVPWQVFRGHIPSEKSVYIGAFQKVCNVVFQCCRDYEEGFFALVGSEGNDFLAIITTGCVHKQSHHLAWLCSFMTAVLRVSGPHGCVLSSSNVLGLRAESLAQLQTEF